MNDGQRFYFEFLLWFWWVLIFIFSCAMWQHTRWPFIIALVLGAVMLFCLP